jgi:hypothetical protein
MHIVVELGRCLAQLPQLLHLGDRLGHDGIEHLAGFHGFLKHLLHIALQLRLVLAVHIDQGQQG